MTFTLSPPIRYAALCALLASVVIGGGLMMMGHKSESAVATPHVINKHPFGVNEARDNDAEEALDQRPPRRSPSLNPSRPHPPKRPSNLQP